MKTKVFFLIAAIAALMTSCNNPIKQITRQAKEEFKAKHEYRDSEKWGKVISKEIGDSTMFFNQIQIDGNVEVVFTQGDSCTIRAYGNEKAIEEYQFMTNSCGDGNVNQVINLKGYTWDATKENHNINQDTPAITVYITAPSINNITVYGAGDIKLKDDIKQEESLNIAVYGAGDVTAKKLEVMNFKLDVNGAGDLDAESLICQGNADFTINGAGDIDVKVKAANAKFEVNGAGDIDANVKCNELNASCNGAGDIKLKGECNKLNKSDGPIGGIDSRDLKVNGKIDIEK